MSGTRLVVPTWVGIATCTTFAVVVAQAAADATPAVSPGEMTAPVIESRVTPEYPAGLKAAGKEGTVVLLVTIGEDGAVRDPQVRSADDPAFAESALRAVVAWRYKPATRDGQPVAVPFTIRMEFRLQDRAAPPPAGAPTSAWVEGSPMDILGNANADVPLATSIPNLVLPVLVKKVPPRYPHSMDRLAADGKVLLDCVIETDGRLDRCVPLRSAHPAFEEAAVEAASQWRYKPALADGKPIAIRFVLRVDFREWDTPDRPTPEQCYGPDAQGPSDTFDTPPEVQFIAPIVLPAPLDRTGTKVTASYVVCVDGRVDDVDVQDAVSADIAATAATALRRWRYRPARKDGKPVAIRLSGVVQIRPAP